MKPRYCALFAVILLPTLGLALGSDHHKGPIPRQKSWPEHLEDLVNCKDRIHGYWVNSVDVFFFAGDTQALNDFLAHYSKLKDIKLVVVLHPGPKEARSPWDKDLHAAKADWGLYIAPRGWLLLDADSKVKKTDPTTISRVDVWLGGRVRLADLQVPQNVAVESGGEIEDFVRKRQHQSEAPRREGK